MTTKTPPTQVIIAASLAMLCLSGCNTLPAKPSIEVVYQLQFTKTFHLDDYFIPFQNGFLHIVLFLLLFTTFQFWQNQRRDYLCYSLYLLITWLYFARAFSVYFYPFFPDHDSFCDFDSWLKKFAAQTEFIFFCMLTSCYLLFVFAFFELKKNEPLAFRVTCYTLYILAMAATLQLIVLIISRGENYLLGPPETMLKNMFTLPAAWLMFRIMRAKLPGVSYIVLGSGALLAGSIWVGILHFIGDPVGGKRVYIQMGVLIEILFFSAALGRKERNWRLHYAATLQEKQKITQEKQKIEHRLRQKLQNYLTELQQLQAKLAQRYNGNNSLKPKPAPEETFTQKLERVLSQNYMRPDFRVRELALLMQLEQQTLNRRVKEQCKVNSVTYLCHYRLEQSKTLMLDRYLKLQDIAAKVGFSQYDEYSRRFKEKEGITPRKFRQKLLGGSQ